MEPSMIISHVVSMLACVSHFPARAASPPLAIIIIYLVVAAQKLLYEAWKRLNVDPGFPKA